MQVQIKGERYDLSN